MSKITQRKQALAAEIQGLKLEQEKNTPEFIKKYKNKLPAAALLGGLTIGLVIIFGVKSKKKKNNNSLKGVSPLWAILIPVAQWGLKKVIAELSKQVNYKQLYQVVSNKIKVCAESRKSTVSESELKTAETAETTKNLESTKKRKVVIKSKQAEKARQSNQTLSEKEDLEH